MKPRTVIREELERYQRRRRLGDPLPPITKLADLAGVHRDTVYAAIEGDRLNERSWRGLNKGLEQLEGEIAAIPSGIMSVQFTARGPVLKMGLGKPLFRRA